MNPDHKSWNDQHKRLRQMFGDPGELAAAIDLFLQQHAMVHDAKMSNAGLHSFSDEVWREAGDSVIRCVPAKFEHSIAWLLWHIVRIEDMTMNTLLAGKTQIFHQGSWLEKLKINVRHSGNVVMDKEAVTALSQAIDIDILRAGWLSD